MKKTNASSPALLRTKKQILKRAHKKSGFVRKTLDGKPIWWDSYLYAILEEEWIERNGSPNDNISV